MLVSSVQAVKSTIIFVSRLGPAESLFQESYYELMKKALKPDGVLCCQGKCNIFICKIDAMYAATDQRRVIVISYIHATRECQSSIRCKKTTKPSGNHCLINTNFINTYLLDVSIRLFRYITCILHARKRFEESLCLLPKKCTIMHSV